MMPIMIGTPTPTPTPMPSFSSFLSPWDIGVLVGLIAIELDVDAAIEEGTAWTEVADVAVGFTTLD